MSCIDIIGYKVRIVCLLIVQPCRQDYRKLIALRKSEAWKETFVYGDFAPAYEEEKDLFAFKRSGGGKRALILANFGKEAVELNLKEKVEQVLLANLGTPYREGARLLLRPCETVVLQVS